MTGDTLPNGSNYALSGIKPVYTLNGITALRRAADVCEACAYGERVDAGLVLFARMAERLAQGTLQGDEVEALVRLMRG